jgi:L-alanine-DL-glutamate epimerase-like enolase superfamily enzyme
LGYKWDINRLIEKELIDYTRVTLPNVGGISEFMKIVALAETHYIGMIPHFTGPFCNSGIGAMPERDIDPCPDGDVRGRISHVAIPDQRLRFQRGKLWPNDRPGLGLVVDRAKLTQNGEIRDLSRRHASEPAAGWFLYELNEMTRNRMIGRIVAFYTSLLVLTLHCGGDRKS